MMKKAIFAVLSVVVMTAFVTPVQCAELKYAYVTFWGDNADVGEVYLGLFIRYQASGTSVNMQGTLLAREGITPVALTGSGDLEEDGTLQSFNLSGTSPGALSYNTYDFNFNINTSKADVTITENYQSAITGNMVTNTYVIHGIWDFRYCLNN